MLPRVKWKYYADAKIYVGYYKHLNGEECWCSGRTMPLLQRNAAQTLYKRWRASGATLEIRPETDALPLNKYKAGRIRNLTTANRRVEKVSLPIAKSSPDIIPAEQSSKVEIVRDTPPAPEIDTPPAPARIVQADKRYHTIIRDTVVEVYECTLVKTYARCV